MSFISNAKHYELLHQIEKAKLMPLSESLQQDIEMLEQLYQDYQTNLAFMRKLVEDYDNVQRRLRVGLRKEQITAKHKRYA